MDAVSIGRHNEHEQYHSVFPGAGRKQWSDLPLILDGVNALSTAGIPNLLSVEIQNIKKIPRTRGPATVFKLFGDHLNFLIDHINGHQKTLAFGVPYHIEFMLRIEPEDIPIHLYLSHPGLIVTNRIVLPSSRKAIRDFLEFHGYCSASTSFSNPSLSDLFVWIARAGNPTMTQMEFVELLGRQAFEALCDSYILNRYDLAHQVMCARTRCCCQNSPSLNTR